MRMIDRIRSASAPSHVVQAASRGALPVPAEEMIEILVFLTENPVFAERARLTLAGWDEKSSLAVAANSDTPKPVLDYLISLQNLRPVLLPNLLANPSVDDDLIADLASRAAADVVEIMISSERINASHRFLRALIMNPVLTELQTANLKEKLEPPQAKAPAVEDSDLLNCDEDEVETDTIFDDDLIAYLDQHADEISAEGDKPFQPIGGFDDDYIPAVEGPVVEPAVASAGGAAAAAAPARKAAKHPHYNTQAEQGSALQKISKLDIKGRIQLAFKGTKEERAILIRDGTKLVAISVLDSPKATDSEVERYASQKNVLEAVLRGISMRRRFMKSYGIVRSLVFNPRTPLDISLTLIKHLLPVDLKNLSSNKDVADTIRKLSLKMLRQKLSGKPSM